MTKIIATFDNFVNSKANTQYFWFYDVSAENYDSAKYMIDFQHMYVGQDKVMEDIFQFVNIRKIPANTPYCVYIKATCGVDSKGVQLPNRHSLNDITNNTVNSLGSPGSQPHADYTRVLRDSEAGLVDWYIDDVAEVFINEIAFDRNFQRAIGIPEKPHKLHILTGAYRNKAVEDAEYLTGVKVHSANPFEKWSSHIGDYMENALTQEKATTFIQQIKYDIETKVTRQYSSLIYNRVPRPSRALLLDSMKQSGSLSKSYYSWGLDHIRAQTKGNVNLQRQFVLQDNTNFEYKGRENVYNYIDAPGRSKLEQIYDTWYGENVDPVYFPDEIDKITLTENQAHNINTLHPKICDFKVVTETVYSQYTFLTEKTFKAIRTFMPFVIFGNPQTIENLERLGYNTYGKWIDHSYDKIWEFTPRLQALTKEIDRLSNLSSEDWAQMRLEMLPSMIYNYQHLLNNYGRSYGHVWFE